MRYPHTLAISRPDPDDPPTQDPDTGLPTGGGTLPIYDGPADVQDEGEVLSRDEDGRPTQTSDATAYLEDESAIGSIELGDGAHITWEDGSEADARVQRVVRLDGKVHLEWV